MIKPFYKTLCTLALVFSAYCAFSQTKPSLPGDEETLKPDNKTTGTSSFKFGINYLSNNVFMGRTDTVTTSVFSPQMKYTLKSGVYFSGALSIIPSRQKKKLDGGDLTAGYDFDITDKLSGDVSYTKLFYSTNSTQISSSISSTFAANLSYDIGSVITPSVNAEYNINAQGINNDLFLNFSLSHDFIVIGVFGTTDILFISPTAAANTGTENFYDAYLTRKKFRNAKRTASQDALIAKYSAQLGQFTLLDYELSAPLQYKSGHFIFQFIPTYAVVKNQIPKQIAARLSDDPSVFYFETGVTLKF
jgi:hypothetical protein